MATRDIEIQVKLLIYPHPKLPRPSSIWIWINQVLLCELYTGY